MKKSVFFLFLLTLNLSSCSLLDDEPEIVTKNCETFDFGIPESEWIILPEGTEYTFEGEGKTVELASDYSTNEAYTIQYEKAGLRALVPIGLPNRDCFSFYNSFHNSIDSQTGIFDEEIGISFDIGIENNGERVDMFMGFDEIFFKLEIVNDTIAIDGGSFSGENFEPLLYQNFSSLSLSGSTFRNVVTITNPNTQSQPQKIYLAKDLGLFAFEKNDTLWLRN